ncbi:MFS transporter [Niabella beijingensis]|uniref:MFS transporter n=1 Tax=Niabella beijingensis TaxID=2872700 RepID=UPI001CBD16BB|nr:MFS transporter [Niabella beijingensis]MBZ4191380.1 MFS transporter [Niabella beijingensis]
MSEKVTDIPQKQTTPASGKADRYRWVVVGLLWFVALLNYLDRQMLSTMRDSMQHDIKELQSAENFGILMAVFLWIYGFMSPVSGIIADKLNKKWLIVGSLFVWSAVTYLMGHATSFHQLYLLRATMGVSEALYIPAGLALITEYHESKTRSLAIGIHMTGLYMGQALGGFGATVARNFSWQLTFHWFGIIGIVYSVVLLIFLRSKKQSAQGDTASLSGNRKRPSLLKGLNILFTNLAFWVVLFYFAIPSLPGWAAKNWLPTLFAHNLNLDMHTAGPLATITIAVSSFIGVITGGTLSDRWVQKNLKGRVYTSAAGLSLTIPALLLLGFGNSLFSILTATFLFGVGFGIFDANNMPILCQFVSAKYRATAYGLMNMTGVFAGAFVTDLLGKATDAGNLGKDFALMSVIVLVAVVIQLAVLKPRTNNFSDSFYNR